VSRRRLLIAHPGATSLLYPLVALLQRMDLDMRFETLFYDRPGDTLHRLAQILPGKIGRRLARELGRRSHPDIDPTRVATAPITELVHIASARLLSPAQRALRRAHRRDDPARAA
jgi:alpha-maltose-1-phosphate synthase